MAGPRRFLLYCPTKGSQYTGDFFGHDRLFDVALNDWTGIGMGLEPAEYVFAERGHKWPCIKANLPKLNAQYDYYAFFDYDIEIDTPALNRLFTIGESLHLDLFQAGLGSEVTVATMRCLRGTRAWFVAQHSPEQSTPANLADVVDHYREGRFDAAEAACRKFLRAAPHDPDALNLFGALCGRRGNWHDAFQWILQALGRQPDQSVYLHNCGFALEQMGREVEALVFYRQSQSLAPGYREARTSLERLTQRSGSAHPGSG